MKNALSVFRFLLACAASGEKAVLVTLTGVTGGSARAPGAHMAVSERGATIGSFSGGCVEAAVMAEALQVLADGKPRTIRFGAGSPFMDIRLPCGGGIDLLFSPDPSVQSIRHIAALLDHRRPAALHLCRDGEVSAFPAFEAATTGWCGNEFLARHNPDLRIVVIGHGAEPAPLLALARVYGAEIQLLSPDEMLVAQTEALGIPAAHLQVPGPSKHLRVDEYTALVALFHDHDWETALILQALMGNPFFVGAMGSARTHAERCRRLLKAGATPEAVARIVGPIGIIPATRDPDTLAISVLAQIVQHYQALSTPSGDAGTVALDADHGTIGHLTCY